MGFKEPKSSSHRGEVSQHGASKRLSAPDGDNHVTKKRKRAFGDLSGKQTSVSDAQHSDKKVLKDRPPAQSAKLHPEGDDAAHRKASALPPFPEAMDPNDSDMESNKSDVSWTREREAQAYFCEPNWTKWGGEKQNKTKLKRTVFKQTCSKTDPDQSWAGG